VATAPAVLPLQALYEAGRYEEVVARASNTDPEALFLAAESYLRLGRRDEAISSRSRAAPVERQPFIARGSRRGGGGLHGTGGMLDPVEESR